MSWWNRDKEEEDIKAKPVKEEPKEEQEEDEEDTEDEDEVYDVIKDLSGMTEKQLLRLLVLMEIQKRYGDNNLEDEDGDDLDIEELIEKAKEIKEE